MILFSKSIRRTACTICLATFVLLTGCNGDRPNSDGAWRTFLVGRWDHYDANKPGLGSYYSTFSFDEDGFATCETSCADGVASFVGRWYVEGDRCFIEGELFALVGGNAATAPWIAEVEIVDANYVSIDNAAYLRN